MEFDKALWIDLIWHIVGLYIGLIIFMPTVAFGGDPLTTFGVIFGFAVLLKVGEAILETVGLI